MILEASSCKWSSLLEFPTPQLSHNIYSKKDRKYNGQKKTKEKQCSTKYYTRGYCCLEKYLVRFTNIKKFTVSEKLLSPSRVVWSILNLNISTDYKHGSNIILKSFLNWLCDLELLDFWISMFFWSTRCTQCFPGSI